jgi:two-component system phosphate regulon sensor histidine kinase PhoR
MAFGWMIVAALALLFFFSWVRSQLMALTELRRSLESVRDAKAARPVLAWTSWPLARLVRTYGEAMPELEARIGRLERDGQQLHAVLSGMADAVIAVDARRRLLFANARADVLFGTGPQSVGRRIHELVRSPSVQDAVDASLAGPSSYRGDLTINEREGVRLGSGRHLAVTGTPLPGSPPPGAVLVFHDVTELRRLERMRQDFVANASHELKTPLAAIKAYTETLLNGALRDENVNIRFLKRIEEQSDRLNHLVLDLLSLARMESGGDTFDHTPVVFADEVEALAESHRERAETLGLTYTVDVSGVSPETMVLADGEALRQIIDNLVDNAIKYSSSGRWVKVCAEDSREGVQLRVSDGGIGIPREALDRVFERFYRVDAARSRELGGTGLGLSIVKHLAQALGGRVSVESRLGQGSTFSIHLPRMIHSPEKTT